jgi:hypothetical protein
MKRPFNPRKTEEMQLLLMKALPALYFLNKILISHKKQIKLKQTKSRQKKKEG